MGDNEEFVPIGFDIRQFESGSESESDAHVNECLDSRGFPLQLQYRYLLDKAMKKLDDLRKSSSIKSKIPLDVRREGTRISFNMKEIAQHLNRSEEHLTKFILNELSTTGNINSEGRLSIKGRFTKKQIQDSLKDYVDQFVICKSCFKTDSTQIIKENRMFFLKCTSCNASRHVGNITEGYYRK
ncbi:hypothetical protein H311_03790 [Anncaliia algerae PRA109]|nr:hypothetical protein H311_03790 [Anncaliia algerae PRA109]